MVDKDDISNRPKKLINSLYLDSECHRHLTRLASREKLSVPNMINHFIVNAMLNKIIMKS